jgi:hypothetical protein
VPKGSLVKAQNSIRIQSRRNRAFDIIIAENPLSDLSIKRFASNGAANVPKVYEIPDIRASEHGVSHNRERRRCQKRRL